MEEVESNVIFDPLVRWRGREGTVVRVRGDGPRHSWDSEGRRDFTATDHVGRLRHVVAAEHPMGDRLKERSSHTRADIVEKVVCVPEMAVL